jgi:ribosomal protein L16/L10AE
MGKGKGSISHWESRIKPQQIFFEFAGLSHSQMSQIFTTLKHKSPLKIKWIGHKPKTLSVLSLMDRI